MLLEQSVEKVARLVLLLDEGEDLVDLVGHDIAVLVLLVTTDTFSLLLEVRVVILVLIFNFLTSGGGFG